MKKLIVIMSLVSVIPAIGMDFNLTNKQSRQEKVDSAIEEINQKRAKRAKYTNVIRQNLLKTGYPPYPHFLHYDAPELFKMEREAFRKCENLQDNHSIKRIECAYLLELYNALYKHAERGEHIGKLINLSKKMEPAEMYRNEILKKERNYHSTKFHKNYESIEKEVKWINENVE